MDIAAEQDDYRHSKPSLIGRGIDRMAHPLGELAASVIPNDLVTKVLDRLDALMARIPRARFDHDPADLAAVRAATKSITRRAQAINGASGAAAGFGGIFSMSADIPATIAVALHSIRETARAYGFDDDGPAERIFRLQILELAATGKGAKRAELIERLERSIRGDGTLVTHKADEVAPILDQIIERVSRALVLASAGRRAGMAIPVIGAAVGGAVNVSFQRDVSRAARFAYQERRIVDAGNSNIAVS